MDLNIKELEGKTIINIILTSDDPKKNDKIIFECSDDSRYKMYHEQDCCELVIIEDICGELDWLLGSPILKAEERTNGNEDRANDYSQTWTFYELATIKGSVTIRWYGTSNGYYSESVQFVKLIN